MTAPHYSFDSTTIQGRNLNNKIQALSDAWSQIKRERDIWIQMQDNAASGDDVYALIGTTYGFPDNATAHAAFSEIDSMFGNCDPAVSQALARFLL